MKGLSRKLHALEDNLLEFPPDDEDILMFIGDADEQTLPRRATVFSGWLKRSTLAVQKLRLQVLRKTTTKKPKMANKYRKHLIF